MDKGHPEGLSVNKPCTQHPTRNPRNAKYFNGCVCVWGHVFPRKRLPRKVLPEVETTGDLVLGILPVSRNRKMMRSADFLLFSSEKWHPKALKCPWKYGGARFLQALAAHAVEWRREILNSCFLANPFRLPASGSETPPEPHGLCPVTHTCH